MKVVRSKRNLSTTADTDRAPSAHIWADCPWEDIVSGTLNGAYFFDDFVSFPKTPATTEGNWGQYAQFSSSGGTLTAGTGTGGELVFTEATDNEGVSLRTLSTPFKISRSNKKLWFEVRLKFLNITDSVAGAFVGLMENAALTATVPIAADGTIADQNLVGFHRLEADGDQIDFIYKANGVTQVTVDADMLDEGTTAVAADTYLKLGMVFEHRESLYSPGTRYVVTPFYNGIRGDTVQVASADGTDFPNDVSLGFVIAMLLATSASFTMTLDWVKIAQLYEDPN